MEQEIWKSIPKLEGKFKVSNFGRVKKCYENFKGPAGEIIEIKTNNYGYKSRTFRIYDPDSKCKKVKVYKIHRLVGELFIENKNPEEFNMINHIDGVKINNHYTNLEWTNALGNVQHAIDNGLRKSSYAQKLTIKDVRNARQEYNDTQVHLHDLAKTYDVSNNSMLSILTYKSFHRVDPHLKDTYKINSYKGEELQQWLEWKYLNKNNPTSLEVRYKQLTKSQLHDILYAYVNSSDPIIKLEEDLELSSAFLIYILNNSELPKVTILEGETFIEYNGVQISNKGRYITKGRAKKSAKYMRQIAEYFVDNPNNYKQITLIDDNLDITDSNIQWVPSSVKIYDYDEEEILESYLNGNINKIKLAKKFDIPLKHVQRITKGYDTRTKSHLCSTCGETNPDKFYGRYKSMCSDCYKGKYYTPRKKEPRPHMCKTCGETNPENFYKGSKGMCKKCSNEKNKKAPKN